MSYVMVTNWYLLEFYILVMATVLNSRMNIHMSMFICIVGLWTHIFSYYYEDWCTRTLDYLMVTNWYLLEFYVLFMATALNSHEHTYFYVHIFYKDCCTRTLDYVPLLDWRFKRDLPPSYANRRRLKKKEITLVFKLLIIMLPTSH